MKVLRFFYFIPLENKSLGYGFVQLESFVDAHKALKNLNETEFKGTADSTA